MSENKPKCPLRGMDVCIEGDCAWFYGELDSCAIWAIAAHLQLLEVNQQ